MVKSLRILAHSTRDSKGHYKGHRVLYRLLSNACSNRRQRAVLVAATIITPTTSI